MQLIYAYIGHYRCLDKIGFSFSPYYNVEFNEKEHDLIISENTDFPENFFPPVISSITAIVGNNGAGKSTVVTWLLKALVDGSGETDLDGIIVFRTDNDKFVIYTGKKYQHISVSGVKSPIKRVSNLILSDIKTACGYFSGHFNPYDAESVTSGELAGETNISDTNLLRKDLQNYANIGEITSLRAHINAFIIQNNYRIAQLLSSKELRDGLSKLMRLPKYLIISPNDSWQQQLYSPNNREIAKQLNINIDNIKFVSKYKNLKFNILDAFIQYSIFNYLAENIRAWRAIKNVHTLWIKEKPSKEGPISDFNNFIHKYNIDDPVITNVKNLIEFLDKDCLFPTEGFKAFCYIKIEDSERLEQLSRYYLLLDSFLTARFFDITYSLYPYPGTPLSSGEFEMLNLLSRIYWHFTIETKKIKSLDKSYLYFLDEAEIGYHPEWQQQYLWILIWFFSFIGEDCFREYHLNPKFQIIYTTHSPISLSDLPKECINFLFLKGKNTTENHRDQMPQTFGRNIFELYRDSFFMSNGLMGCMAQNYIHDIDAQISQGNINTDTYKNLEKRISLIGDERIRDYLIDRLISKKPNKLADRIEFLESELAKLKEEQKRNEEGR